MPDWSRRVRRLRRRWRRTIRCRTPSTWPLRTRQALRSRPTPSRPTMPRALRRPWRSPRLNWRSWSEPTTACRRATTPWTTQRRNRWHSRSRRMRPRPMALHLRPSRRLPPSRPRTLMRPLPQTRLMLQALRRLRPRRHRRRAQRMTWMTRSRPRSRRRNPASWRWSKRT